MSRKLAIMVLAGVFFIVFILLGTLYLNRTFSQSHLDDVSPGIECEPQLYEKSDILWVIPFFEDSSISNDRVWCSEILSLNKTIGLHGVYHDYREFDILRDKMYIESGIDVFEECFGYKPEIFKAPQLVLSKENRALIESMGMVVYGKWGQITSKAYHCGDTGLFSNRFIWWI